MCCFLTFYANQCFLYISLIGGYLFIIGGMNSSNASSYINLTSSTEYAWTDGPAMHHERSKALCIVDERTNTLYAIGGEGYSDMESFDVTSPFSEWSLLDATLPSDICCGNAMLYGDYIFLVGAPTPSSKVVVFVIDRSSQSVYSPDGLSLVMDRVGPSSIIIDDILYLFSGEDLYGDALTSWEYVCLNGDWYAFSSFLSLIFHSDVCCAFSSFLSYSILMCIFYPHQSIPHHYADQNSIRQPHGTDRRTYR